jgi:hypothetical protein
VSTIFDLAGLYPDIAAAGSLGAAMHAAAAQHGLSFAVTITESAARHRATVASVTPHRAELVIDAWPYERRWSIRGCESVQGMALIEGRTDDLAQLALLAQAWHDGTALVDIHRAAPFVQLTGRFEVPDHDPVRLAESEWQHLLNDAAEDGRLEFHALIETAYAEPTLRQLYPYTSHWVLRFSTRIRPDLSDDVTVCLYVSRAKTYVVAAAWNGPVVAETTTPSEAVSLAVRHVPTNCGSVASGAADQ